MQGMVGLQHSGPVIRRSFENCPLGTEENGSFLSRGGVAGYRPPRIVLISYVWTHIPNHAEKYDIKTAGSRLVVYEKNKGMVRGSGANVVDGRDSWRGYSGCHGFTPLARHFKALLRRSVPDDWAVKNVQ